MATTDQVSSKLARIKGQVDGLYSMYEEGRTCLDVVQQIAAVRSALSSVGKDILAGEASRCARIKSPEDFDRILKSLLELT
ncbi:MAG TPA: metal-sensitive transcriptional regulator [Patescibacteria group bacterium]|nr:metal-sensitive transcriptional regulator [Patescibacteria group bacterium]